MAKDLRSFRGESQRKTSPPPERPVTLERCSTHRALLQRDIFVSKGPESEAFECVVPTGGDDALAVGRELRLVNRVGVALQSGRHLTAGGIPDPRGLPKCGDTITVFETAKTKPTNSCQRLQLRAAGFGQ
jgi:hypothetical protein